MEAAGEERSDRPKFDWPNLIKKRMSVGGSVHTQAPDEIRPGIVLRAVFGVSAQTA